MTDAGNPMPRIERTQADFARLLARFVSFALAALFLSFVLYATELVPSAVRISEVPTHWHLSAAEYAARTETRTGWNWLSQIGQGRTIAFAALALFPAGMVVLTAASALLYARDRVTAYGLISFVEVIVLLVAASGVLAR